MLMEVTRQDRNTHIYLVMIIGRLNLETKLVFLNKTHSNVLDIHQVFGLGLENITI